VSKRDLFDRGVIRITKFCEANNLIVPEVRVSTPDEWRIPGHCAYYRPTYIAICLERCAHIGTGGASWSYPGYTVDREPYGVLAHEIGHHVDVVLGNVKNGNAYNSEFSKNIRKASGEEKLTNYCPNDGEWFAEMMRLFITNPDLLRLTRPITFRELSKWLKPVETRPYDEVLIKAPARTFEAVHKKILKAEAAAEKAHAPAR